MELQSIQHRGGNDWNQNGEKVTYPLALPKKSVIRSYRRGERTYHLCHCLKGMKTEIFGEIKSEAPHLVPPPREAPDIYITYPLSFLKESIQNYLGEWAQLIEAVAQRFP